MCFRKQNLATPMHFGEERRRRRRFSANWKKTAEPVTSPSLLRKSVPHLAVKKKRSSGWKRPMASVLPRCSVLGGIPLLVLCIRIRASKTSCGVWVCRTTFSSKVGGKNAIGAHSRIEGSYV